MVFAQRRSNHLLLHRQSPMGWPSCLQRVAPFLPAKISPQAGTVVLALSTMAVWLFRGFFLLETGMLSDTFLEKIEGLEPFLPRCSALEAAISVGVGYGGATYWSQRGHWQEWLSDYDGPGPFGRMVDHGRRMDGIYRRIACPPMLFWLAEAVGVAGDKLDSAFGAVMAAPARPTSRCAALRRIIPWETIEAAMVSHGRL